MKNGRWRKSRSLNYKVALTIPHSEKIEHFMFAKGIIQQKPNGKLWPVHRTGLLNLSDVEIVEHYNSEARVPLQYLVFMNQFLTLSLVAGMVNPVGELFHFL
mgnify:CR=1 FL=1